MVEMEVVGGQRIIKVNVRGEQHVMRADQHDSKALDLMRLRLTYKLAPELPQYDRELEALLLAEARKEDEQALG